MFKAISNKISDDDAVAFCMYSIHTGKLTIKHLKQHKCIEKNCQSLLPRKDHPYWKENPDAEKFL